MADDTVEAARRALFIEADDCLERAFAQRGKGSGRIVELTDALIAAVRAENAPTIRERQQELWAACQRRTGGHGPCGVCQMCRAAAALMPRQPS